MLGEPTPLGGRYQQFDPPAAGAGGRIVFAAAVLGPGFRRALFLAGPSGAVPLLKTGDGAPGGGSIPRSLAPRSTIEVNRPRNAP